MLHQVQQKKSFSRLWIYSVIWKRRQWARSSKLEEKGEIKQMSHATIMWATNQAGACTGSSYAYHKCNEHGQLRSKLGVSTHAWKSVGRTTARLQFGLAHFWFHQRCHHIVLVLLSMMASTDMKWTSIHLDPFFVSFLTALVLPVGAEPPRDV